MELRKQTKDRENLWIEQAAQGDLDAFNELVLSYQDMTFNHARTLVDDLELAEDVTQDSFVKAFQAIRTFRGGSFEAGCSGS